MNAAEVMPTWPEGGLARVPYRLFSDPEVYALEQERLFRGPVWNYLCLELEVAEPGDFRTSAIGETPIVVARDEKGALHGMVNRCAHKGALVCLAERGNRKSFSCIYHAWTYDLGGAAQGRGLPQRAEGQGRHAGGFRPNARHRMQPIRVEVFCGLVFGTFEPDMPPVEEWIGPTMGHFLKRNLGSRPLKLLGVHSQIIHNNWKLYAENVRDSYHATLLHTFYTTFKVNRLDMDGGILLSEGTPWHHISYAKRATLEEAAEYTEAKVHSASYNSQLKGPELLETGGRVRRRHHPFGPVHLPDARGAFHAELALRAQFRAARAGGDRARLDLSGLCGRQRGNEPDAHIAGEPDRRGRPGLAGGRLHQRVRPARHQGQRRRRGRAGNGRARP